jgi:hypothetical protein
LLKVALNTIKQTNKLNIRCEAFAWFAYIALRSWSLYLFEIFNLLC